LGVLAVFTVVLVTVGIVSVLSLRGYVTTINDAEVAKSLHAFDNSYTRYRNGEHASGT
jgi:two-component system, OmpR family, sensor histidine kinase TrcS